MMIKNQDIINTEDKTFYIVGGVNGAGKSTFINKFFKYSGIKVLNFDNMAYEINGDYSWKSYLQASEGICKLLKYWPKTGKSLVWETLLTSNSYIERIDNFRKYGYKIDITYIFLKNKETHIQRIEKRFKNGGHNIYSTMLDIYFENKEKFLNSIITNSDIWRIISNQNTDFEKVAYGVNNSAIILNNELLEMFSNSVAGDVFINNIKNTAMINQKIR